MPQTRRVAQGATSEARFQQVIREVATERGVTTGGKGFGSNSLKVNGRMFAFVSTQGAFVVKIPKTRVDELVARGQATPFDPGNGRRMKEWAVITSTRIDLIELAREAYRFVKGQPR